MFNKDLIKRCLWTFFLIVILELGRQIALPNIDIRAADRLLNTNSPFKMISGILGGQMTIPALFSLGVGPYMTSMIIWQAVTLLDIDAIDKMAVRTQNKIQRVITLGLAFLQGVPTVYMFKTSFNELPIKILGIDITTYAMLLIFVAGAMLVAWMADVNADKGIGGVGMLIVPGVLSSMPSMLVSGLGMGDKLMMTPVSISILVVSTILFVYLTVALNKAELHITLQRPMLDNDYAGSYMPVKILAAGAMPFMFSTSLFMIPRYFVTSESDSMVNHIVNLWFSYTTVPGIIVYCFVIILLGYGFSFVNFKPSDVAKDMKESGAYFYGIYPGDATESFLISKLMQMTFVGNTYLVLTAVIPLIAGLYFTGYSNFAFYFGNLMILITMFDNLIEQGRALAMKDKYTLL